MTEDPVPEEGKAPTPSSSLIVAKIKGKCVVEECKQNPSPTNSFGMCFHHGEWLKFLLWALPRIAMSPEATTPSGLVIPK